MKDRVLTPFGIEETLLALRLRNQPAPELKPEDWSVLDHFLVGDIRQPDRGNRKPERAKE